MMRALILTFERALWVLDRIGGAGRDEVLKFLKSEDVQFRTLAVKILGRRGTANCKVLIDLLQRSIAPSFSRSASGTAKNYTSAC